ncbi:glycerol-3-phosphate dehydrogenase/oxidase [Paenibacillus tarimensis]|uniref:glycerol-3-phosphate dehydrogenase/oxidase n=1 Tax=Paenibacillus tarimensis TaxID=416012 RepID=UPI001F367340|nr:FAD-dependent oxidoreductase [Paenibacillus tarimensis]MCF2944875.1 glycerol-3-phosphate dehydrogenase/oxidase [Paenibacillus tarimensis]
MNGSFSSLERTNVLEQLEHEQYDVLIIGGGITGAGIALDAATRGMKTALIEMQDFAAGTSSRSTKLVHGGLRYLKQLEVKMVAEVGKEREVVYRNGQHVTTPERMLLPFHKGGTFGSFTTSLGLMVYDRLAGVKRSERRVMLSREETLAREPLLKQEGLLGGGDYVEYRTDDARLTIEVLKRAVERGACAANYLKAEKLLYEEGKLCGLQARDMIEGDTLTIRARKIVNAAGPWVDSIRELDKSKKGKTLRLTKGVHLVFDQSRFPLRQAVYFDTPDKRMVFAIPRDGKTYVGTTDTDYSGDIAHPTMSAADRDYILQSIRYMFPDVRVTGSDVESSWAGLRPLIYEEGKSPSEVSRKDEIFLSPSGLLTIAGGKLTGYRKMAETVTDRIAAQLAAEGAGSFGPCVTAALPISGGDFAKWGDFDKFVLAMTAEGTSLGLSKEAAERLVRRYGSNVGWIFGRMNGFAQEAAEYNLPVDVYAELMYAIEEEMAVTPVDYFMRRTGTLFFDIDYVTRWMNPVLSVMADRLGWSEQRAAAYRCDLERQLHDAVVPSEETAEAAAGIL